MKSVLSRNYRQLIFQLLELNLSCNWVTIFKLFNLYESENIIGDFINEEYIVNENLSYLFNLISHIYFLLFI